MPEVLHRITRALAARYRIEREVGHGGMAVVFLARDLRHDRPVAIKVLRPELAGALGPARFLREIQLAARLTHPHILPMLDSGEADGLLYYSMPFVEGDTLRQRLEREKQLPVEDTLRIAREVADALDYAHRQGIVHRDIKPENVLFTAGHAVVADFGIAHAMEAAGGGTLTTTGVVLGTPAYLSPEQAAGSHAVDARTDQYALGCVVYEMLAGQPPFTGPTAESLMHQHLNVPARAVTELRPAVPGALAGTIARALAKNPADRFADTARFADSLVLPATPTGQAPGRASARRPVLAWVGGLALLAALVAAGTWAWLRAPRPAHDLELTRLTFDTGAAFDPAISRDGKLFAYASDRGEDGGIDLWVQQVGQHTPLRLTHDEALDCHPAFSPDGAQVVFWSTREGGGLYVVSTLGGDARRVVDGGTLPRFSPDGTQISYLEDVAYAPGGGQRMFLASPDGGAPRPFQPEFVTYAPPTNGGVIWSPDGSHLMFYGYRPGQRETRDWYVAPAGGGPAVRTGALRSIGQRDVVQFPCLWLPRHVIFVAGTTLEGMNLFRTRIHPGNWKVTGPVEQLTAGPGMKYYVGMGTDGTTVLSDLTWVVQLWAQDLDPTSGLAAGEPACVTSEALRKASVSASHDGTKLAYCTYSGLPDQRRIEIRLRDLSTGRETVPVTSNGDRLDLAPVLDAQGTTLAYQDRVDGTRGALVLRAPETAPRVLCRECAVVAFLPGSGDAVVQHGPLRLTRLNLESGAERDLLRLGSGAVLDTDAAGGDRWLAVLLGRPDRTVGLYSAPVLDSAATERDLVLLVDGPRVIASPRWSTDGSRVYFLSDRDGWTCVWMQRVDRTSGRPVGECVPVLHNHGSGRTMFGPRGTWTIALAGDRLVFNAAEVRGSIWRTKLDPR